MADSDAVQAWKHWCPTVVMKHATTGKEVTVNADEASRAPWIAQGYKYDRDGPARPDPSVADVPAEIQIEEDVEIDDDEPDETDDEDGET